MQRIRNFKTDVSVLSYYLPAIGNRSCNQENVTSNRRNLVSHFQVSHADPQLTHNVTAFYIGLYYLGVWFKK